jgi:hypothetical protein
MKIRTAKLVKRLDALSPECDRQWGKMSPSHDDGDIATGLLRWASGNKPIKQVFLGKALSWIFQKGIPRLRNLFIETDATGPDFIIKDDPDFDATREKLKQCMAGVSRARRKRDRWEHTRLLRPANRQTMGATTQYKTPRPPPAAVLGCRRVLNTVRAFVRTINSKDGLNEHLSLFTAIPANRVNIEKLCLF